MQESHTEQLINLLLALGACDSRLYPNVHRLLLIACTPAYHKCRSREVIFSTEETEDLCARSTMTEERLANLSSPCITKTGYKDRVPADEVCSKSSTEIVHTVFV